MQKRNATWLPVSPLYTLLRSQLEPRLRCLSVQLDLNRVLKTSVDSMTGYMLITQALNMKSLEMTLRLI